MNGKPFMFTETEINGQALNLKSVMKWTDSFVWCNQVRIANKSIENIAHVLRYAYTFMHTFIQSFEQENEPFE